MKNVVERLENPCFSSGHRVFVVDKKNHKGWKLVDESHITPKMEVIMCARCGKERANILDSGFPNANINTLCKSCILKESYSDLS